MTNFEVITTADKDVRDRLFQDLRKNGTSLEKQVVKFSSNESIKDYGHHVHTISTKKGSKLRLAYQSTWSVAYPTKEDA